MIRAILFDLDETLLDLNGDQFLEAYIEALSQFMPPLLSPEQFTQALWSAAAALGPHHPSKTNQEILWNSIADQTGVSPSKVRERMDAFTLTDLSAILPGGTPVPGSRLVVETARDSGLKIVVATNPIYPLEVIRERLRRAELDDIAWDGIATWNFHSTKPYREYYLEWAGRLGVDPENCLMVGDDYFNDIPARDAGMETFYVGRPLPGVDTGRGGTLSALAHLIRDEL